MWPFFNLLLILENVSIILSQVLRENLSLKQLEKQEEENSVNALFFLYPIMTKYKMYKQSYII